MTLDQETGEELGCPKCHMFGCGCESGAPKQKPTEICTACRRNKAACICKSHAQQAPVPISVTGDPIPGRNVQAKVNEALLYYYDRDAVGLERFIRRLAAR